MCCRHLVVKISDVVRFVGETNPRSPAQPPHPSTIQALTSHDHPVHNASLARREERVFAAVRSALPGWNTKEMFLLGDRFWAVTKTSRAVVQWLREGGLSTARLFSLWGVTQMRVGLTKAVLAWAAASAIERSGIGCGSLAISAFAAKRAFTA